MLHLMFTINVLHVLEKKIIYVRGEEFLLNNAGCHDITLWTGWLEQGFPDGANGKNLYLLHWQSLCLEDTLEGEMATHSSILA